MNNNNISEVISAYLEDYADAPHRKHPEPSPEIIELLRKMSVESFNVIEKGMFQRPENLDPSDLDDPLCRLLITFVFPGGGYRQPLGCIWYNDHKEMEGIKYGTIS